MKIGIVGSGMVGATSAYAMLMQSVGREIVLVDKDEKRALAEAQDLLHAVPFSHPLTIRCGCYRDLHGCRAVVICAGVAQREGESRLDLLKRNAKVFEDVVPSILDHAKDAVLVVATNPVDIMTHVATRFAERYDVPASRIIGSGTTLDTARFRALLGHHVGVDSQHMHAYVIGEHGDSEVPAWSLVSVGALSLDSFCRLHNVAIDDEIRKDIDDRVRNAAYSIIQGKGATYYGIGSAVAKIVDVIIHDQRSILTLSALTNAVGQVGNVTLSLPRLLGGNGIIETFPLQLRDDEQEALQRSARVIREATDQLEP